MRFERNMQSFTLKYPKLKLERFNKINVYRNFWNSLAGCTFLINIILR